MTDVLAFPVYGLVNVLSPLVLLLLVVLVSELISQRDRLDRWLERRRERARFLALAKEKQARREQREREVAEAGHSRLLYLVRLLVLVLEPGERSNSALRQWLFGRTELVQVTDQIISRSVRQHQARGEVLQARRDRAGYRDRLARGIVVYEGADLYSLRGAHLAGIIEVPPVTARSHRTRHRDDFPAAAHQAGSTSFYRPEDLTAFYQQHPELLPKPAPAPRAVTSPDGLDDDGEDYHHEWTETGLELLRRYLDR